MEEYIWSSPNRLVSQRPAWWYALVSLGFLAGIIAAAIFREVFLVLALLSTFGLIFVSQFVKPRVIRQKITKEGLITSNGRLHAWREIKGFFLTQKGGNYILVVDMIPNIYPDRIMLLVGSGDPYKIVKLMEENNDYLTKDEVQLDIVNTFTYGTYVPYSNWIESSTSANLDESSP